MPLGTLPPFSAVKAFFAGSDVFSDYRRGGPYVPNIPANAAISTVADGLALSQFSGADKSTPPSISATPNPRSASAGGRSGGGTISSSVTLTCSGGNGSYSVSSSLVSSSGVYNPTHSVTGTTQGNAGASLSGAAAESSVWGTTVIRYTVTSNGQTGYVDVTYQWTWNNNTPACVVTTSRISPISADKAGDLTTDDRLWITDPYQDVPEVTQGQVRKSETHARPCVRIETANGAWLECSLTAPIPTQHEGYVPAEDLLGSVIPTITSDELAAGEMAGIEWTEVVKVEHIGERPVQLLYVEDRAFWASGDGYRFILHHNAKNIL